MSTSGSGATVSNPKRAGGIIAAIAVAAFLSGAANESTAASSWQVSNTSKLDFLGTARNLSTQTIAVGSATSPYNWKLSTNLVLPRVPLAFGQYIDFLQNGTAQGVLTSATGQVTLDLPLRVRDSSGASQTVTAFLTTGSTNGVNSDGGPYCTGGAQDPSYCRGTALNSSGAFRMVAILNIPQSGGTLASGALLLLQVSGTLAAPCVNTVCTALDTCHVAGTCDPATGACSNPAAPNGTACNDGNACTQSDSCQSGACVGANPVTCTAIDACHLAGTCNPSTGVCSNLTAPNGAACSDGNACTRTDTCQSGVCAGANPVVCVASDTCHAAGTCNPATGACSNPPKPDGSACDDGNVCTSSDTCVNGACGGVSTAAPPDAGSTVRLRAGATATEVAWNPVPGASAYDVARGLVSRLPVGAPAGESCLGSGLTATQAAEPAAPALGEAYWYLVRGSSVCGAGSYGFEGVRGTPSVPRATGACTISCRTVADCPAPNTECGTPVCNGGVCGRAAAAYGLVTAAQTAGDCRRNVCDGLGGVTSLADDADLPVDVNACTNDVCSGGIPSNPPSAARTACNQNGGTLCDGAGACVACLAASDCPGTDSDCRTRTCGVAAPNACGVSYAPSGSATTAQTAGDCRRNVCDGSGGLASLVDNADLPIDGNTCTYDRCTSGTPSNPPLASGTACTSGTATGVCDGSGTCLPCGGASQRCCASYPYCRPGYSCSGGFCR